MESVGITVICALGLASGQMLKVCVQRALFDLNVQEVDIDVRNVDCLKEQRVFGRILVCSELLKDSVTKAAGDARIYPIRSLLDIEEVRQKLLVALEEAGINVLPLADLPLMA